MSVNKELKVKSFRVDEDTFSKFKNIAAEEFGNQGQCLDALINLYETEQSKGSLITRKLEIESFQDYINKINRLFVTSLQMSEDAEERAKEGFLKKLEAKEMILLSLKEKIENKDKDYFSLKDKLKTLTENNDNLISEIKVLEENKSTLTQLANRNYDLSEELKKKIVSLEKKLELTLNSERELEELREISKELKNKNESLQLDAEKEKTLVKNLKDKLLKSEKKSEDLSKEKASYQLLLERLKIESEREKEAIITKCEAQYKKALKERIDLLEREHNLEVRELEFKIKILEKNND